MAVIADMHCHYPMHLLGEAETYERMVAVRGRPRLRDKLRALIVRIAAERLNYRDAASGWRVSLDGLERGDARLVLSVLYEPFAEFDLDVPPRAGPEEGYFGELIDHLEGVERELGRLDPAHGRHAIVRTAADLDDAVDDGRVAFVHCVEGGFHLGATPASVARNVAELAHRGIGYVTLAHLFYRGVVTNAPALPMLSDRAYDCVFPQPRGAALSQLGEAAVRAMYEQRVLIDVSHMRADALAATFDLLERLDAETGAPPERFPVIASHAGFRFGGRSYMLDAATIRRIAARDGVIGLILARGQLEDGRGGGEGLDHTVATIRAHVDAIHAACGSHDHVGIGSDLDGFIRPTMSGIEAVADLSKLVAPLRAAYPGSADAILSGNALRVVRRVLAQRT